MQLISITTFLLVVLPSLANKPTEKDLVRRVQKSHDSDAPGHSVKIDASGALHKSKKAGQAVEEAAQAHPAHSKAKDLTKVAGEKEGHHDKKHSKVHADFHEELKEEEASNKFRFEDDDENDVALDELEAMTIESAMLKKHPVPRRRAVNCKWTEWENAGRCSQTCGGGMQPRKRKQAPPAAHGGWSCDGKDNDILKPCDNDPCPTTPAPTPAPTTTTAATVRISEVSFFMLFGAFSLLGLNSQ